MNSSAVTILLAFIPLCASAPWVATPALADTTGRTSPYDVCKNHNLSPEEFNRCVSAVYIRELRKSEPTLQYEQALKEVGAQTQQCVQRDPCIFNPETGRYQECQRLTAAKECLRFGGPCAP